MIEFVFSRMCSLSAARHKMNTLIYNKAHAAHDLRQQVRYIITCPSRAARLRQPYVNGSGLVKSKGQILTFHRIHIRYPLTDLQKFVTGYYVGDLYTCNKFGANTSTGAAMRMGEI